MSYFTLCSCLINSTPIPSFHILLNYKTVVENPFQHLMLHKINIPKELVETISEDEIFVSRQQNSLQIIQENQFFIIELSIQHNSARCFLRQKSNQTLRILFYDAEIHSKLFNETFLDQMSDMNYLSFLKQEYSRDNLYHIICTQQQSLSTQFHSQLKYNFYTVDAKYSSILYGKIVLNEEDSIRVNFNVHFIQSDNNEITILNFRPVDQNSLITTTVLFEEEEEEIEDNFLNPTLVAQTTIIHVANFLLQAEYLSNQLIRTTPLKLQKICYYAQGLYLALYNQELFVEDFQSNYHGPFNRNLHDRGNCIKNFNPGNWIHFNKHINQFLFCVLQFFNNFEAKQLEYKSHKEDPWISTNLYSIISKQKIGEYFHNNLMTFIFFEIYKENLYPVHHEPSIDHVKEAFNRLPKNEKIESIMFYKSVSNTPLVFSILSLLLFSNEYIDPIHKIVHLDKVWQEERERLFICVNMKNCLAIQCLINLIQQIELTDNLKQNIGKLELLQRISPPYTSAFHMEAINYKIAYPSIEMIKMTTSMINAFVLEIAEDLFTANEAPDVLCT